MDIESYPQVLHFIRRMEVLERGMGYIIARVSVGLPGLTFSYDCRIEYEDNRSIRVKLISGPFKRMDALWEFEAVAPDATKVTYSLDAQFHNLLLEKTAGAIFASQLHHSIRAFEERLKRS